MSRPLTSRPIGSSSLRLEIVSTPGIVAGELVKTMVVRFGSGLPMDSKVFRPITTTWPVVIFLNHLKSSGRCQGILFPAPITRLRDMAAMALKGFTGRCWSIADKASTGGNASAFCAGHGIRKKLMKKSSCAADVERLSIERIEGLLAGD